MTIQELLQEQAQCVENICNLLEQRATYNRQMIEATDKFLKAMEGIGNA